MGGREEGGEEGAAGLLSSQPTLFCLPLVPPRLFLHALALAQILQQPLCWCWPFLPPPFPPFLLLAILVQCHPYQEAAPADAAYSSLTVYQQQQ